MMAARCIGRQVGIEKIPRCRETFEQADNVMRVWIELWHPFIDAHRNPVDEELIGQIYEYACWCWTKSRNYDIQTAVACGFYEHLPLETEVRQQVTGWLSVDLFENLKEVFRYRLHDQLDEFVSEFYGQYQKHHCPTT